MAREQGVVVVHGETKLEFLLHCNKVNQANTLVVRGAFKNRRIIHLKTWDLPSTNSPLFTSHLIKSNKIVY